MAVLDRTSTLEPIREKVEAGERLDLEDGLALMESDDILGLGELADLARRQRGGGDEVYFVQNLYLNQTNVCRVKCKFCAFAVTQKQEGAYTYTAEELVEDALRQRELTGFTEIHMVGGESPHVDFDYYVEIVRQLHEAMPDVHLKLFTASEIHHMTTLSGLTHEEVLRELRDAGSARCPAAAPRSSPTACAGSSRPGRSIPTTGSTSTGSPPARHPDALHDALRARRDVRGAGRPPAPAARAPGRDRRLPRLHPARVPPGEHGLRAARLEAHAGSDDLKMIAVSRLLLDNVPNVKAYWIMMGLPLAQVALHFGANDVQGTVVREEIFHAAGATTETEQKIDELVRVVREAGRIPCSGTRSTTSSGGGTESTPPRRIGSGSRT